MAATMRETAAHITMPDAEFVANPPAVYAPSMDERISFICMSNKSPLTPNPSIMLRVFSKVNSVIKTGNSGSMTSYKSKVNAAPAKEATRATDIENNHASRNDAMPPCPFLPAMVPVNSATAMTAKASVPNHHCQQVHVHQIKGHTSAK